ncbi:MAG: CDP-glycerol glycerophosphotransferase family protein [Atopobiaceae bacterium]|nr:CDP-glycerol glycerophosphotransferase family protein [Atopobiaceae bacterium]
MAAWTNVLRMGKVGIGNCLERIRRANGIRLSRSSKVDLHKVVLSCNLGRGYLCNPKYIAEALNRIYPGEFDIVLLVNKPIDDLPSYIRQVRRGSSKAQRELASARVWIYNFRNDKKHVPKREDQFYFQTWHACLGPKRCEGDAVESLSAEYVRAAKYDGSITDLMFANNASEAAKYQRAFWYKGPILRCGIPRNRPLLIPNHNVRDRVRTDLGLEDNRRLCLYAPTFRNGCSFEPYRFDYERVLNALEAKFGEPFAFAYRLHPNLASLQRPDFLTGLIDATDYLDQQELLAVTDVLISDYSSILEDFSLTRRPAFVYASDFDDYANDRGLYYPLNERPFPIASTKDELVDKILAFDEDAFLKSVDAFFARFGLRDDGLGDERVARVIHALSDTNATIESVIDADDVWEQMDRMQ